MRFSHKDKKDRRVQRHSTYALEYPARVDEAPEEQGVYILLNQHSDVLFVATSGESGLRATLMQATDPSHTKAVVAYRWFVTPDNSSALELVEHWIEKYQPNNQPVAAI